MVYSWKSKLFLCPGRWLDLYRIFDPVSGQFMIECMSGNCEMGPNHQNIVGLVAGQMGCLDEEGHVFCSYSDIDFEELSEVCVFLG